MADNTTGLIRPNYFDRQQLTAADLSAEQQYFRERLRRHNRFLHGWGVVCGAEVTRVPGDSWKIAIGEGYAVTPHGDEIYIPSGSTFDTKSGVEYCLGVMSSCAPTVNSGQLSKEGPLLVIRAQIDPAGKDTGSNYNEEWVDVLVLKTINLNGYKLRHVVNPGTPKEGRETYYTFTEEDAPFVAGAVIRIHSGAQRHHKVPEPGFIHRYRASREGNWRLNNTGDTIFVLDAKEQELTSASFLSGSLVPIDLGIFLIACPAEMLRCPQPAIPTKCQPNGGKYEYSRVCDTVQFRIVCQPPLSHAKEESSCVDLAKIVCGYAHVPCPPVVSANDNCVVLARITMVNKKIQIDDTPSELSHRRQFLSEELLLAYLHCQCEPIVPPSAAFTANKYTGTEPLEVKFSDNSDGEITSRFWNFGDNNSSDLIKPVHTYQRAGVYLVVLTVAGPGGMDMTSHTVTVSVAPPVAAFAASPTTGYSPLTVNFTDRSSGHITSRAWNFNDGSTSSEVNPVHRFQQAETYNVVLTVTGPGGSNSASQTITVRDVPPVAAFAAEPTSGFVPLEVKFTDQSSGHITSRVWNFNDGSTSSQVNPVHTYQQAGTYTVTLTVSGPGGSDSANLTITAEPATPPPVAAFVADPTSGFVPLKVQFTDESSGQITSWSWDFGDGSFNNLKNPPDHVYQLARSYTAKLIVAGPGGRDTATRTITVRPERLIQRISPTFIVGSLTRTTKHQVSIFGRGLADATSVVFADRTGAITNLTITRSSNTQIDLSIELRANPDTGQRPFTIFFPDGTQLPSGAVQLDIRVRFTFNIAGEELVVTLDENEFDLIHGREEAVEVVSGIGTVRGERLREVGADSVLALAAMPPEQIAEIIGVNIDIATRLRDNALDRLRR